MGIELVVTLAAISGITIIYIYLYFFFIDYDNLI